MPALSRDLVDLAQEVQRPLIAKIEGNDPSFSEQLASFTLIQSQWLLQQTPLLLSSSYPQISHLSHLESLNRGDPTWARPPIVWEDIVRRLGGVEALRELVEKLGGTKIFGKVGEPGYALREEEGGGRGGVGVLAARQAAIGDGGGVRVDGGDARKDKGKGKEKAHPAPPTAVNPNPAPIAKSGPGSRNPRAWSLEQYKWLLQQTPVIRSSTWTTFAALMNDQAVLRDDPTWVRSAGSLAAQWSWWKGEGGLRRRIGAMEEDKAKRSGKTGGGNLAAEAVAAAPVMAGSVINKKRKAENEQGLAALVSKKPNRGPATASGSVQPAQPQASIFNQAEQSYIYRYLKDDVETQDWESIAQELEIKSKDSPAHRSWSEAKVEQEMETAVRKGGWFYQKKRKREMEARRARLSDEEEEVGKLL